MHFYYLLLNSSEVNKEYIITAFVGMIREDRKALAMTNYHIFMCQEIKHILHYSKPDTFHYCVNGHYED